MAHTDNYQIQLQQAKTRFLTYDQEALIRKMKLEADEAYLYVSLLAQRVRICRRSGDMQRLTDFGWVCDDRHSLVMTLLDLICDSREDRCMSGQWKAMTAFGLMFHQNLAENSRDPWAARFETEADLFRKACLSLGGQPFPQGDIAHILELIPGLPVVVQLWFGDEEFPASLRFLWDKNSLQYLKYETMWYAKALILDRLAEQMK